MSCLPRADIPSTRASVVVFEGLPVDSGSSALSLSLLPHSSHAEQQLELTLGSGCANDPVHPSYVPLQSVSSATAESLKRAPPWRSMYSTCPNFRTSEQMRLSLSRRRLSQSCTGFREVISKKTRRQSSAGPAPSTHPCTVEEEYTAEYSCSEQELMTEGSQIIAGCQGRKALGDSEVSGHLDENNHGTVSHNEMLPSLHLAASSDSLEAVAPQEQFQQSRERPVVPLLTFPAPSEKNGPSSHFCAGFSTIMNAVLAGCTPRSGRSSPCSGSGVSSGGRAVVGAPTELESVPAMISSHDMQAQPASDVFAQICSAVCNTPAMIEQQPRTSSSTDEQSAYPSQPRTSLSTEAQFPEDQPLVSDAFPAPGDRDQHLKDAICFNATGETVSERLTGEIVSEKLETAADRCLRVCTDAADRPGPSGALLSSPTARSCTSDNSFRAYWDVAVDLLRVLQSRNESPPEGSQSTSSRLQPAATRAIGSSREAAVNSNPASSTDTDDRARNASLLAAAVVAHVIEEAPGTATEIEAGSSTQGNSRPRTREAAEKIYWNLAANVLQQAQVLLDSRATDVSISANVVGMAVAADAARDVVGATRRIFSESALLPGLATPGASTVVCEEDEQLQHVDVNPETLAVSLLCQALYAGALDIQARCGPSASESAEFEPPETTVPVGNATCIGQDVVLHGCPSTEVATEISKHVSPIAGTLAPNNTLDNDTLLSSFGFSVTPAQTHGHGAATTETLTEESLRKAMLKEEARRVADLDQEWGTGRPCSFLASKPTSTFAASSLAFSRSDTLLSFFGDRWNSDMSFQPASSLQGESGNSSGTGCNRLGKCLRVTGGEWYEQRPSSEPCGASESVWKTEEATRLCDESAQTYNATFLEVLQNELNVPSSGRPPPLPELVSATRSKSLPHPDVPPEEVVPTATDWEFPPAHEIDDEEIEEAPVNLDVPTLKPAEEVEENVRPCLDLKDGTATAELLNSSHRSIPAEVPSPGCSRRGSIASSRPPSRRGSASPVSSRSPRDTSPSSRPTSQNICTELVANSEPVEFIEVVAGAEILAPATDDSDSDSPPTDLDNPDDLRQLVALAMLKANTEGGLLEALLGADKAHEDHVVQVGGPAFMAASTSGLQLAESSECQVHSESNLCAEVLQVLARASVNGTLGGVLDNVREVEALGWTCTPSQEETGISFSNALVESACPDSPDVGLETQNVQLRAQDIFTQGVLSGDFLKALDSEVNVKGGSVDVVSDGAEADGQKQEEAGTGSGTFLDMSSIRCAPEEPSGSSDGLSQDAHAEQAVEQADDGTATPTKPEEVLSAIGTNAPSNVSPDAGNASIREDEREQELGTTANSEKWLQGVVSKFAMKSSPLEANEDSVEAEVRKQPLEAETVNEAGCQKEEVGELLSRQTDSKEVALDLMVNVSLPLALPVSLPVVSPVDLDSTERALSSASSSRSNSPSVNDSGSPKRTISISDLGALGKYRTHVARHALLRGTFRQWQSATIAGEQEAKNAALCFFNAKAGKRRPSERSDVSKTLMGPDGRRQSQLSGVSRTLSGFDSDDEAGATSKDLPHVSSMQPSVQHDRLGSMPTLPEVASAEAGEEMDDNTPGNESNDDEEVLEYGKCPLRPWEKPQEIGALPGANFADRLLKHLGAVGKEFGAEAIEVSLWADGRRGSNPPKSRLPMTKVIAASPKTTAQERAAREERRKERLAQHLSKKNLHGPLDPAVWGPVMPPTVAKESPRGIYMSKLPEVERPAVLLPTQSRAAEHVLGPRKHNSKKRKEPPHFPPSSLFKVGQMVKSASTPAFCNGKPSCAPAIAVSGRGQSQDAGDEERPSAPPQCPSMPPLPPASMPQPVKGRQAAAAAAAEPLRLPPLSSPHCKAGGVIVGGDEFDGLRGASHYAKSMDAAHMVVNSSRRLVKIQSLPAIPVRHRVSPAEPPRKWRAGGHANLAKITDTDGVLEPKSARHKPRPDGSASENDAVEVKQRKPPAEPQRCWRACSQNSAW